MGSDCEDRKLGRREWLAAGSLLSAGLLGGASRKRVFAQASSEPPALREISDPAERRRVQELIEQARRERELNWIGVLVEPQQAQIIVGEFRRYYGLGDFRVNYTYTSPGELITKVEELLRAGRREIDVVYNSAYPWFKDLRNRGALMRYESPHYSAFTISDKLGMSMPGYWVSDMYSFTPSWNRKLLVERGLGSLLPFRRWWDFVNPRLRGLVSVGDVLRSTSHAETFWGLRRVLGDDWFRQLKQNVEPVTYTRAAQGRDWLVTGEFPVTLESHAKNTQVLRDQGATDIELLYPEEGTVLLPFTLVILASAPHPGAAKLFVDFMRSRYGAEVILKAGTLQFPGRPDVQSPYPDILPDVSQVKAVPIDWNRESSSETITEIRTLWRRLGLG